jgi:protein-L-isoaspartate(D-aspartate) O-methyltransferase
MAGCMLPLDTPMREMVMTDRARKLREFYAELVCASVKQDHPAIARAFGAVPREPFAGPGPWSVMAVLASYVATPDDDPAFLYQDVLLALDRERGINIGMPSAHALWLGSCDIKAGETVVQIGAGTGYYTTILAELVGNAGRVIAYEIDDALAARARVNLAGRPRIELRHRSGVTDGLPEADVIYVCAGAVAPAEAWLDALRPGGRLLFPLAPEGVLGGMLLITRPAEEGTVWPARMVSRAQFIGCAGLQDDQVADRLKQVFARDWEKVRSFRRDGQPDGTCWYAGEGWWLSTKPVDEAAA